MGEGVVELRIGEAALMRRGRQRDEGIIPSGKLVQRWPGHNGMRLDRTADGALDLATQQRVDIVAGSRNDLARAFPGAIAVDIFGPLPSVLVLR